MPTEQESAKPFERESAYDLRWIGENMYLFDPLACEGFERVERGAIVVNLAELILKRNYDEGHPFNYRAVRQLADWWDTDEFAQMSQQMSVQEMLADYDPSREMVVVLIRDWKGSAYRIPLLKEDERDPEIRGAYVKAEAEERNHRLTSVDPWARDFRLAAPHAGMWPEIRIRADLKGGASL
jgi:hypothetical protein